MSFWKVPATSAFVHLALPPCPSIALNYDRNLFVYTFEMIKIEIMPLNAKISLNDMLISASFGHGQLKSIKNQSHPHFHFDTHRSGCEGKDKLNKTSTRDGKSHHGVLNGFAVFLFYETQHVSRRRGFFYNISATTRKNPTLRNSIPNIYTYLISLNNHSGIAYELGFCCETICCFLSH